jgi:hypothetical protein
LSSLIARSTYGRTLSAFVNRESFCRAISLRSFRILGVLPLLILAGCGGSTSAKTQTVKGDGFSYVAPVGWTVVRKGPSVAAVDGDVNRVEVVRFTLEKPYRPALFAAAAHELDGVADRLANQLAGSVSAQSTTEVAGRKARSYTIDYGPGKTQEIAFVLDGSNEFQLLCRRDASSPNDNCAQLFATFALG